MAEKNNAKCSICNKDYYMCISCKDMMKLSPWKMHTCSSEHYKIFQIIKGYTTGVYNKQDAKSKFQSVDLSDMNSLRTNIKKIIKDITAEDKQSVKTVEESKTNDDGDNAVSNRVLQKLTKDKEDK